MISSTSSDKAKYKQMLVDWIVALWLMFVMQYIMSFSNLLVEKIIDLIEMLGDKFYKPRVLFLENVKNLQAHDNGRTYKLIKQKLTNY